MTYFLGGSSAKGFQTRFGEVVNSPGYHTYILKGGPGTGKSTLMKKIASHFGSDVDLYYCSSDIKSLDAVVIHSHKAIIVDGTAPHVFNADFPGIAQTLVDLGAFWKSDILISHEPDIRKCFKENAKYHRRARHFITALTAVNNCILDIGADNVDTEKVLNIAYKLTSGLKSISLNKGKMQYSSLSAVTTEGYYTQPFPDNYHQHIISDNYYAGSFAVLEEIKNMLTDKGYNIIVSECMLFDENKIEHILVPSEKLAFSVANGLNKLESSDFDSKTLYHVIPEINDIGDSLKIISSLESEAAASIKMALETHDELESHYIGALDFEALDSLTESLVVKIMKR